MDERYLDTYRSLYEGHWWWRSREALLTREIARLADGRQFSRILDVGCGDGLFFPVLQRFGEPYGVEPATAVLSPDGPWRARIHAGPLDESYQPPAPFGLVLALDVIEHLNDPAEFLSHVCRVTAPGGWFIATVPAFRSLWTTHDDLNAHVTRYRRDEFVGLVAAHGFDVVHARNFFILLAAAKLATGALERVLRLSPHAPQVPLRLLNATLLAICRAEQAILGRRAVWFGSSLLLVAQRQR